MEDEESHLALHKNGHVLVHSILRKREHSLSLFSSPPSLSLLLHSSPPKDHFFAPSLTTCVPFKVSPKGWFFPALCCLCSLFPHALGENLIGPVLVRSPLLVQSARFSGVGSCCTCVGPHWSLGLAGCDAGRGESHPRGCPCLTGQRFSPGTRPWKQPFKGEAFPALRTSAFQGHQ